MLRKYEKDLNNYIQPHLLVLQHTLSLLSTSSIPVFRFAPNVSFYLQRGVFHLTPGITFEYNVSYDFSCTQTKWCENM